MFPPMTAVVSGCYKGEKSREKIKVLSREMKYQARDQRVRRMLSKHWEEWANLCI